MPVIPSDVIMYLSGGSSNTDPEASLGGEMSSEVVSRDSVSDLFDDILPDQSAVGRVDYRCVYIYNDSATDDFESVVAFISIQSISPETTIELGVDPAGVGDGTSTGVATVIAEETDVPTGVSFSLADEVSPVALGDLAPGEAIAFWIKRTVTAGASDIADTFQIAIKGDTP